MVLKVIFLLCVVYAAAEKDDKPDNVYLLKWPSSYSIEARKYYMSSGLVENFKYWKSSKKSRLEANDGAVIKIKIGSKLGRGTYEIHPETTEKEINKMVCVKERSYYVRPEELLPQVKDLTQKGTETVRGIDCVKFTNEGKAKSDVKKTLWAYPLNGTDYWIPVRYKTKEVDEWHGYSVNYEIWDYSNFNDKIDLGVFNVTYNCTIDKKYEKTITKSNADYLLTISPEEMKEIDDTFSTLLSKTYRNKNSYKLNKLSNSTNEKNKKYKGLRKDKPGNCPTPGSIPFPYSEKQIKKLAESLPKEYDLRVEGHVGPVLDHLREGCESAWAFAVTATVEGALARGNGSTWMKLSEQALIDCSWGYGNKGCKGGSPANSYQWIMKHGLPLELNYGKYTNKNGYCKMENMTKTFKIKGFTEVPSKNVEALKVALTNHGPVSVNVYGSYELMMYDGGIFYDQWCHFFSEGEKIPMTLIGYGEQDGGTFWILKESKGPYWGVGGYIYISAKDNNCGVMDTPTYAVV